MVATAVFAAFVNGLAADGEGGLAPPFPDDASRWVGEAQSWAHLEGRVALLNVWTFG